jgi:hypothetical protein
MQSAGEYSGGGAIRKQIHHSMQPLGPPAKTAHEAALVLGLGLLVAMFGQDSPDQPRGGASGKTPK